MAQKRIASFRLLRPLLATVASAAVALSFSAVALAEPTNLALGRPYKVTVWEPNPDHEKIAATYPDTNNVELTDGNVDDSANLYNDAWVGFLRQGGRTVTIDLGREADLSKVLIRFLHAQGAGIGLPNMVQVSFSVDGTKYGPAMDLTPQEDVEKDTTVIPFAADLQGVKARYVQVSWDNPIWVFVDEIQVMGE